MAVLHDLTLAARFMDRLILIDQGQVVAEGRPDQVLSDANLQTVYKISTLQEYTSSGPLVLPWQRTDREGQ